MQHIAVQAAKPVEHGAGPPIHVLSDYDVTIQQGWLDKRYPPGTVFPGVLAFLEGLRTGAPGDRTSTGNIRELDQISNMAPVQHVDDDDICTQSRSADSESIAAARPGSDSLSSNWHSRQLPRLTKRTLRLQRQVLGREGPGNTEVLASLPQLLRLADPELKLKGPEAAPRHRRSMSLGDSPKVWANRAATALRNLPSPSRVAGDAGSFFERVRLALAEAREVGWKATR